jgi:hypothetical protein
MSAAVQKTQSAASPAVLYSPRLPRGLKRIKQASPGAGPPLDPSFNVSGVEKPPALLYYPEWCDSSQIKPLFGFARATAYNLWAAGKIKAITFREKGKTRGKRLFSCESIRQFLASCEQ